MSIFNTESQFTSDHCAIEAREQWEIMECCADDLSVIICEDYTEDDRAEARQILDEHLEVLEAIGHAPSGTQREKYSSAADSWDTAENYGLYNWADRATIGEMLKEDIEGNYDIPHPVDGYIDWDGITENHLGSCTEFTINGETLYSTSTDY